MKFENISNKDGHGEPQTCEAGLARRPTDTSGLSPLKPDFPDSNGDIQTCTDTREKHALLFEEIVPQPLQYRDIPKTVDSTVLAFADDPIVLYIREPARTGPVQRKVYRCMLYLEWLQFVAHKRAWTVNHGESIIIRQRAENDPKSKLSPQLKLLDACVTGIIRALKRFDPKVLRQEAYEKQVLEAFSAFLGGPEALKDMIELGGLATHPASQGLGYASALMPVVTDLADAQGRATFLASSNVANLTFYNSHGFQTVGSVYVGADDPTWRKPPIRLDVMLRLPETPGRPVA